MPKYVRQAYREVGVSRIGDPKAQEELQSAEFEQVHGAQNDIDHQRYEEVSDSLEIALNRLLGSVDIIQLGPLRLPEMVGGIES